MLIFFFQNRLYANDVLKKKPYETTARAPDCRKDEDRWSDDFSRFSLLKRCSVTR